MWITRILTVLLIFSLLPLVCFGEEGSSPRRRIEYVYVDANVGGSSGGHAVLKFGNTVYHFQYFPDGLFRIVRDNWRRFRYIYNDLQNRTLQLAWIDVSPETYERIRNRLTRLYLVQNKHLSTLAVLQANCSLLESHLFGDKRLLLRGVGLFSEAIGGDIDAEVLRTAVSQRYGASFLAEEIRRLEGELQSTRVEIEDLTGLKISREQLPSLGEIYAQQYIETRLRQEALITLAEARSLDEEVVLDPAQFDPNKSEIDISPRERNLLYSYFEKLRETVLELINSRRPDSGYPLLLAIARYQAVGRSLRGNRLLLLDPFSDDAITVERKAVVKSGGSAEKLAHRAWLEYAKLRNEIFAKEEIDEMDYNLLEESAGRCYELHRGITEGSAIRVEGGRLIPSKSRPILPDPSPENRGDLLRKLEVAEANRLSYMNKVRELYRFRLIGKNCATELSWCVNSAFENREETVEALGGYLAPGEAFTFIPFRLFHEVQERFRIGETGILPSYRKRHLAQMYRRENPVKVYVREFNTLTSTLYERGEDDTIFLFFTDDVLWPRPLYGLMNIAYGLLNAGAGILTLPKDRGERGLEGLRGAFFSLPELFFFNIRKGSFELVEDEYGSLLTSERQKYSGWVAD